MAGFLSNSSISGIESLYNTLHTTFARTITVYKNSQRTVISTTPQYNPIYRRTNTGAAPNIETVEVSSTFDARIYYAGSDEEFLASEGDQQGTQNKIILPDGSVKIVVKSDAFEYLKEARRVEFDGKRFNIKSDGTPFGLTGNLFFTFLLTPIDE